jgi:sporulation protein YlmC with PRC-barrel domain
VANSLRFVGGAEVECADAHCGSVARLIMEPATRSVTHLTVEETDLMGSSRIVPIDLVEGAGDSVVIRCSKEEFDAFEHGEERLISPDYAARGSDLAFSYLTLDQVPDGEVEVSGEDEIRATDGRAGHLSGLEIDATDHRITSLLLEIGHFSGKKTVVVPAASIVGIDAEGIQLSLTRSEIGELS